MSHPNSQLILEKILEPLKNHIVEMEKINKQKIKYVVGIDFGHGETSAAYATIPTDNISENQGTWTQALDIDLPNSNEFVIPSAMAIEPDGTVLIGENAEEASENRDTKFYVGFKKKPEDKNGEQEKLMIKYMCAVYKRIRECVGDTLTDDNHVVAIAMPSGWRDKEREIYLEMGASAGMPMYKVYYESRAAMKQAQRNPISDDFNRQVDKGTIVFDMGSSTLDFTYLCGNNKPVDNGYPCGASKVEAAMLQFLRDRYEGIRELESKYPGITDRLLYATRKYKEKYFKKTERPSVMAKIDPDELIQDDDIKRIKHQFDTDSIEEILTDCGYLQEIRNNMRDFQERFIPGKTIYAALFTGGASRMKFLETLVRDEWKVKGVYRDNNPSLIVSRGIAEIARSDFHAGGPEELKNKLEKIANSSNDVYGRFKDKLFAKLNEEIRASIATPVCSFQEAQEDYSVADLEDSINNNIQNDMSNLGIWTEECMKETFDEVTLEIRTEIGNIMRNYSNTEVSLGNMQAQSLNLPTLDLSVLSQQIKDMSAEFTEATSGLSDLVTGAAVGAVAGFLFSGPIGWIAGGAYLLYKAFFGDNKSEEEKKAEARHKPLNAEQRQKVYNEFESKWDDICSQISNAINNALNNTSARDVVNKQCSRVIEQYINECSREALLMLD